MNPSIPLKPTKGSEEQEEKQTSDTKVQARAT
jgi:hypothetical protein